MENKLHFLLIHGSWHGSWAWENVRSKLSEKNFEVSCPNLTGLGERKHLISNQITIDTFIKDVENHIIYQNLTLFLNMKKIQSVYYFKTFSIESDFFLLCKLGQRKLMFIFSFLSLTIKHASAGPSCCLDKVQRVGRCANWAANKKIY